MDWLNKAVVLDQLNTDVMLGGLLTLVVSTIFYVLQARGLKNEARELRRHTRLLLDLLDEHGLEVTRDEHGEPRGRVREGGASPGGTSDLTAKGESSTAPVQRKRNWWRRVFGG